MEEAVSQDWKDRALAAEAELALWKRRDEATRDALTDVIDEPVFFPRPDTEAGRVVLAGYVRLLAKQRELAEQSEPDEGALEELQDQLSDAENALDEAREEIDKLKEKVDDLTRELTRERDEAQAKLDRIEGVL